MSAGKHQRGSNTDLHISKVDRMSSPHQQDNQTKCLSIKKTSQKDEMMDLPSSNTPNHARSAGDMTDNNIRHCITVEEVQDEDDIPGLHHNNDDNENDKTDCAESASTAAAAIYTAFTETNISSKDPKPLKEAMSSPEWPKWEKAIQTELETL